MNYFLGTFYNHKSQIDSNDHKYIRSRMIQMIYTLKGRKQLGEKKFSLLILLFPNVCPVVRVSCAHSDDLLPTKLRHQDPLLVAHARGVDVLLRFCVFRERRHM